MFYIYIYVLLFTGGVATSLTGPGTFNPRNTLRIEELATPSCIRLQTVDWILGRDTMVRLSEFILWFVLII